MKDQFVTYPIALKLKELGFDEECFCTYHNAELSRNPSHKMDATPIQGIPYTWKNSKVHNSIICAPLWQQVIDWLREKYNFDIIISSNLLGYGFIIYQRYPPKNILDNREFQYYCEAREQAILKALEVILGSADDNCDGMVD